MLLGDCDTKSMYDDYDQSPLTPKRSREIVFSLKFWSAREGYI